MLNYSNLKDIKSVRLKVIEECNWSCSFCHNEGNLKAEHIKWDDELKNILLLLKEKLLIQEVHLTGGEPTINKNIPQIISGCNEIGLKIKLTTNGQFDTSYGNILSKLGIYSINFSIHSLTPDGLNSIMSSKKSLIWANKQIETAKRNILFMNQSGIKVSINSIISNKGEINRIQKILDWGMENKIEVRILDDLNNKLEANEAIKELILLNKAKCINIINIPGTSSSRYIYENPDGNTFVVKSINQLYLKKVCSECDKFLDGLCQEGFYAIRLQKSKILNSYIVILCIQEKNKDTVMTLNKFLELNKLGYYD